MLFVSVGIPPYTTLSTPAQALALLWCASGPIVYVLGRIDHAQSKKDRAQSKEYRAQSKKDRAQSKENRAVGFSLSDLGLIWYGLIEVLGAAVAVSSGGSEGGVLVKAVGVQLVVLIY